MTKIVLNKKNANDDFEILSIQFFDNGNKFKKSLGIRVSTDDFKYHFNSDFNSFNLEFLLKEHCNIFSINVQYDQFFRQNIYELILLIYHCLWVLKYNHYIPNLVPFFYHYLEHWRFGQ